MALDWDMYSKSNNATVTLNEARQILTALEAYEKICRLAGVPEILIEHPTLIIKQPLTGEDMEWARKSIEEINNPNV